MAQASQGLTNRTNRRLARIRLRNPKALKGIRKDGYTVREARQVKRADQKQRSKDRAKAPAKSSAPPYNPLAPLTGKREAAETKAATQMQFGPRERELRSTMASEDQNAVNQGNYYDDYRKALDSATQRIQTENQANVQATQARVDSAFREDSAAVADRNARDSAVSQNLGRGAVSSQEGQQAVQAARSQGNQAAAEVRNRGASDSKYMELRSANAVLAKAQAMAREEGKKAKLREEGKDLAADKGAFAVDQRRKNRADERTWAATQQEFGLKEQDLAIKDRTARATAANNKRSTNAQKIVARLYSSADKASARAQIRVAQLQLKKGKIDAHQYKTIKNIYEGLPGNGGKSGKPKLQTWEQDKVANAKNILTKNKALPSEKAVWLKRMQDEGVPLRLARIAWGKYVGHAPKYKPAKGN